MAQTMPERAEIIRSYENLRWYCKRFAGGDLSLLMVVGPAGVGKSEIMKQSVGDKVFWIEGNSTPFQIYCTLAGERDRRSLHIVLNDAQTLWSQKGDAGASNITLLKQLCETRREKSLSWQSRAAVHAGVPQSFSLTCNVAIIANDWLPRNVHAEALEDRAHKLFFDPGPEEVHQYVGSWFKMKRFTSSSEAISLCSRGRAFVSFTCWLQSGKMLVRAPMAKIGAIIS